LRADCCTPNAVAEILSKDGVVLLHPSCGRCVAVVHSTVDDVEATLSLVQPQLKVGRLGAVAQICCAPFNVKDTIWRTTSYRGEDTAGTTRETRAASLRIGLQVVPIGHDGIIVRNPRETKISPGCIRGRELRVAVGRQINAGKALVVQGEREWQRHGGDCIICVIADVRCARDDTAGYLRYDVLPDAWRRSRCVRWRRASCGRSRGRRACSR